LTSVPAASTLVAGAPAGPAAQATPPAVPTPAPAATLPPAVQLAMHLAPLRTAPDGTHRLTVRLHPAELGRVEVRVEVRDGVVSVLLTPGVDATRDLLREALGDLRRDLAGQGFQSATLDVADPRSGPGRQGAQPGLPANPDDPGSRQRDLTGTGGASGLDPGPDHEGMASGRRDADGRLLLDVRI
jgi:hypothetical protein